MKTKKSKLHLAIQLLFFLLFVSSESNALNYNISFTGTGASTTVESIIVQNLTKGTQLTVPGGNILNLTDGATSVQNPSAENNYSIVYNNKTEGKLTLVFYAKKSGQTQINVYALDGRKITSTSENLDEGQQTCLL